MKMSIVRTLREAIYRTLVCGKVATRFFDEFRNRLKVAKTIRQFRDKIENERVVAQLPVHFEIRRIKKSRCFYERVYTYIN